MDQSHRHDTGDDVVRKRLRRANNAVGNDPERHGSTLSGIGVDRDVTRNFRQHGRTKIGIDVDHEKFPSDVQVLRLDGRRRVTHVSVARIEDLIQSELVPNLEEVTRFDDGTNRLSRIVRIGSLGQLLNDEDVVGKVRAKPRGEVQGSLSKLGDCVEEVLFLLHLGRLVGRHLKVGRQRRLDKLLDEGFAKLDKALVLEILANRASKPSRGRDGRRLSKVELNVGQRHSRGTIRRNRSRQGTVERDGTSASKIRAERCANMRGVSSGVSCDLTEAQYRSERDPKVKVANQQVVRIRIVGLLSCDNDNNKRKRWMF